MVLLPGPDIKDRTLSKVRELARQVTRTNERFLAAKILDRANIINVFTRPDVSDGGDVAADAVTPFSQYSHNVGHAFESAGKSWTSTVGHLALVRGESSAESGDWPLWILGLFNSRGFRKS